MIINVLELFGGIRACYQALLSLGFHVNTLDYVENDKKVVDIANAMFNTSYEPKSVIDYHYKGKDKVDILIGGSPCQDFSKAGLNAGGNKDSNTRSSLMWEQLRILKETMPKYYIWENVKNVLSNKHIHNFLAHNNFIENLGYKVYYDILNAKDFGIPQNRERVFVIAIRNDLHQEFNFNNLIKIKYFPLKNFLENNLNNKYFIKYNIHNYIIKQIKNNKVKLINKDNNNNYFNTLTTQPYRGHLDSGAILEKVIDKWYFVKVNSYVENHFKKSKVTENYIGKTKIIEKNNLESSINTIGTTQERNINSGVILEQTKENEWITISDGTKRPLFKESPNGIITLPLSNNFTSNKVATCKKLIPTLTTNGNIKILDSTNYIVIPRKKDNELINGQYNRVWKQDNYIGALNITHNPKILDSYKTKNNIDKADIYTVNSENYIYDKQTNKPINTIPATGRTAKILENLNDSIFYNRKVNIKDYSNTITATQANFNHRCNTNKILDNSTEKDLLVVNWNNQLWNVRILTELECFRLMGFPDELFYKAQKVGSRPQLYKVAGNSIVVTIFISIFKELFKE